MNIPRLALIAVAVLGLGKLGHGCNLDLSLRAHSSVIVAGDPLFVEVTLTDRREDPFSAAFLVPQRNLWSARLSVIFSFLGPGGNFEFRETYRVAPEEWEGPEVVEPGQSVRYYCCLAVPPLAQWKDAFWREAGLAGGVELTAAYQVASSPGSTATITSKVWHLGLKARPDSELAALALWHQRATRGQVPLRGPTPVDFGLPLQIADPKELAEFVRRIRFSGELGDVLALSLRLRELFDLPPPARDEGNRQLLDYLRKKPDFVTHFGAPPWVIAGIYPEDIAKLRAQEGPPFQFLDADGATKSLTYDVDLKRRVVAGKVRSIALRYELASTAKAVEGLIRDLQANGPGRKKPGGK